MSAIGARAGAARSPRHGPRRGPGVPGFAAVVAFASAPAPPIERASRNDLLQVSYGDRPAETQAGAVLVLDRRLALGEVRALLGERIKAVPRLRHRLIGTPPGCGRPVWVDDPRFDLATHVTEVRCPAPGDERALLDVAATLLATGLPASRPLWAATLVQGLAGGRTGLVLHFNHVLTDGIGGLTVLAHLVDGTPAPVSADFPRPAPNRPQLAADAMRSRLGQMRGLPSAGLRLAAAVAQLRVGALVRAPRCSLNRPTGPTRRLAVARTELAALRAAAHAHGGTVNDAVLTAVAGALHRYLLARGERLERLVVSIPVSAHRPGEANPVGNNAGVVPVVLPAGGPAGARLAEIAARTRLVKATARGATAALMEPVFAALARLRVVSWYLRRQRRVNTFVTNLRGPSEPMSLLGAAVTDVIPVGMIAGNVAVAFGVLSYAGALTVTVVVDPHVCPDVQRLVDELQRELDELARTRSRPAG